MVYILFTHFLKFIYVLWPLALCMVSNQERVIVARVRYIKALDHWRKEQIQYHSFFSGCCKLLQVFFKYLYRLHAKTSVFMIFFDILNWGQSYASGWFSQIDTRWHCLHNNWLILKNLNILSMHYQLILSFLMII